MLLRRSAPTLTVLLAGVLMACAVPGIGDAAKPIVTPDTEILKRTPTIDGAIEDGEWDVYYPVNAENWNATTYANWDDAGLCVAAESDRPIDLTLILDANADGWYNGEDNYQFALRRNADSTIGLTVSRYDSRNSNSAAAVPVSEAEAARIQVKSSQADGSYMVEMRVPNGMIRGFAPASGKKTGLQLNINATDSPYGWVPGEDTATVTSCTLVTKKVAVLKPLVIDLGLRSPKVARGDELVGKLYMTNEGTETVDVYSFVVAGEGKSGPYLSSQKVRMEGVAPKKHMSHEVRTIIPSDMPLGTWAIGAEVNSRNSRIGGALISFDVVEPFELELKLPESDVRTDVKDVTFTVVIKNNSDRDIRGISKISLPLGWELWKNADTREFNAHSERITSVAFKAKPPLGALGEVPVSVEVTVGEATKTVQGSFKLVNP